MQDRLRASAAELRAWLEQGAEIADLRLPASLPRKGLRTASLSSRAALAALHEAWHEARLDDVRPERIGLIVGGSNFQQRELLRAQSEQIEQPWYIRPGYGHAFLDSDLCGLCTEWFDIRGFAYTLGAASASGQVAILQAVEAVRSEQADEDDGAVRGASADKGADLVDDALGAGTLDQKIKTQEFFETSIAKLASDNPSFFKHRESCKRSPRRSRTARCSRRSLASRS